MDRLVEDNRFRREICPTSTHGAEKIPEKYKLISKDKLSLAE